MPIGAYTPKERVVLHMATRQKRRGFFGYYPLLSSNPEILVFREPGEPEPLRIKVAPD